MLVKVRSDFMERTVDLNGTEWLFMVRASKTQPFVASVHLPL